MLHQTCQAHSTGKIQQIQLTYLAIGTSISGEVRKPAQSSVALPHARDLVLKRLYN